MHNGYQDRRRPDRLPHLIRVHDPIRIDTDKSRFVSVRGQEAGGLKHRVVLYLRGHKVSSLLLVREQGPEKGHVIRLASAGGEIYLVRGCPDEGRDLFAGLLHRGAGFPSQGVERRGVPELLREVRLHRLSHLGKRRRGSRVVEVDLSLIHISEPTRLGMISYAVFCLKKKKKKINKQNN